MLCLGAQRLLERPPPRVEGTEAYWAKREADQAALRLQFIKDKGIPPKTPASV